MATRQTVMDMGELKHLEPLSKKLNAGRDELNQSLQKIQEKINALGLGVEVWCGDLETTPWRDVLDRNEDPTGERWRESHQLGYGRTAEGWGLLVRRVRYVERPGEPEEEYDDEPHTRKLLLRAAKSQRAAAVALIPTLIDQLQHAAEEELKQIAAAKKLADSLE